MQLQISKRQKLFIESIADETLYGGAAGGGKSYGQIIDAFLYALKHRKSKQLMLRRTFPELKRSIIQTSLEIYPKNVAKYNSSEHKWTFINGSTIEFGYCNSESDVTQYMSAEYDVIRFDELTHFTEYMYIYLISRLRGANNHPKFVKSTTNPGNLGHGWVKARFIDCCKPDTLIQFENGTRMFIPAKVQDNKMLMENDPNYLKRLLNLSEKERKALLDGNWDIFDGQYFSEFDREQHVVKPFVIPVEWHRYRVFDYGLDMFACYFIAVDYEGFAYVYKEIYEGKDLGDGHDGLIISDACNRMKAITESNEDFVATIAPPDMWNRQKDTGRSAAEIFAENKVFLTKSQNDRVQGWMDVKEWLKPTLCSDGNRYPKIRIFENCINLIRTLPQVQHSKSNPNDVANNPHEFTHGPDAIRYFCAARPLSAEFLRVQDEDEYSYDEQMEDFLNYG